MRRIPRRDAWSGIPHLQRYAIGHTPGDHPNFSAGIPMLNGLGNHAYDGLLQHFRISHGSSRSQTPGISSAKLEGLDCIKFPDYLHLPRTAKDSSSATQFRAILDKSTGRCLIGPVPHQNAPTATTSRWATASVGRFPGWLKPCPGIQVRSDHAPGWFSTPPPNGIRFGDGRSKAARFLAGDFCRAEMAYPTRLSAVLVINS